MRSQPFSDGATVPNAGDGQIAGDTLSGQALRRDGAQGSNEWAVAGSHTMTGHPLVANDPHLALGEPSTFYPIGLQAPGMDVEGKDAASELASSDIASQTPLGSEG